MGRAYAAEGPWLAADPLLHTAPGPPTPSAWLSALALHGLERTAGLQGLRVAHVALVAVILWLAWGALRRASGSALAASVGTAAFASLSAYRLFQLRPHLLTIVATLLLLHILVEGGETPSRRRIALGALLLGLWANLHAGFVLGPVLLAAAAIGVAVGALARGAAPGRSTAAGSRDARPTFSRASALGLACGLGLLATLANPAGATPHLLYFASGADSPVLGLVGDEWSPLDLLALPVPRLPPSPLSWLLVWALLVATPGAVLLAERRSRRAPDGRAELPDPALVAVAAVALLAMLLAVRFLWLGIFPLLVIGQALRAPGSVRAPRLGVVACSSAAIALVLVPSFFWLGDWQMISRAVSRERYREPYPAVKYPAHAVWLLRDAGIEGRLFNDYSTGNFLGYWLAPALRVFVNGSLNFPRDLLATRRAIVERRSPPDGSFTDLLDRNGIDVFLGTGVPRVRMAARAEVHTTTHLEGSDGWIPIFRNVRSAVSLRRSERNRENLERLAAWYAGQGVPFDRERGFDVSKVIEEARPWAIDHGVLPGDFEGLLRASRSLEPGARTELAQERLAGVYALLGLYDRAAVVDRARVRRLGADPRAVAPARRLVWSLLHAGRGPESVAAADELDALVVEDDLLSRAIVDAARQAAALPDDERATLVARLPLFGAAREHFALAGFREPEARTPP